MNGEHHYFGIASMSSWLKWLLFHFWTVKFIILALHLCLHGWSDFYSSFERWKSLFWHCVYVSMVEVTSIPLLNGEIHYFGIESISPWVKWLLFHHERWKSLFWHCIYVSIWVKWLLFHFWTVRIIILALHLCLHGWNDFYSTF